MITAPLTVAPLLGFTRARASALDEAVVIVVPPRKETGACTGKAEQKEENNKYEATETDGAAGRHARTAAAHVVWRSALIVGAAG